MRNKIFTKPERPFLLLSQDEDDMINYSWLESENELEEIARELLEHGNKIIEAIEIGSSRDVVLRNLYD